ncbi:response regulator transcription factor [bacterium]|nr:response regulator transcription factor [bacterium]NUN45809.1 response regulator transcription factor [bacterium]
MEQPAPIACILIADDHAIVRKGLAETVLERYPRCHITHASNADELIGCIQTEIFDVALMDISMPGVTGLEALKQVRMIRPQLPVLILTAYPESQYAERAIRLGAMGYINKSVASDELVEAIRTVKAGKKFITKAVAMILAEKDTGADEPHTNLSDREYEVMRLIAQGLSPKEIGEALSISPKTVNSMRDRILEKMNLTSNAEIIRYAIQKKLVE